MNFWRTEWIILFEIQASVSIAEVAGLSCCISSHVIGEASSVPYLHAGASVCASHGAGCVSMSCRSFVQIIHWLWVLK